MDFPHPQALRKVSKILLKKSVVSCLPILFSKFGTRFFALVLYADLKHHHWTIIVGILSTVAVLSICTLLVILFRRKRPERNREENQRAFSKNISVNKSCSLKKQYTDKENMEGNVTWDVTNFFNSYHYFG